MDARLTQEHDQIQETARSFLEANGGIEYARRKMDDADAAVVEEVWNEITELDYTMLTIPLEHGGFGEGMVYLSALLEVIGRYAVPVPYPETMAFGIPLIEELGSNSQKETYFERIATGECTLSFALYDDANEEVPHSIQMGVEPVEGGYRLSGTKTLVPYGGEVDNVILAVRSQDATGYNGISLFLVDLADVETTQLKSLDQTRPMYELEFDGVVINDDALLGPLHGGGNALNRAIDRFNVAICMMLVGGAERVVDDSVEYGKERTQYGQPIGRFQAVKHRIAEMWMDKEQCRSLTYYAAWALENDEPDAQRAASMAKAYAADNLVSVFKDNVFNHGGMGFTWENDGHIFLKQAKSWQNFLGSAEYHLDRLADIRDYSNDSLDDYPDIDISPYR